MVIVEDPRVRRWTPVGQAVVLLLDPCEKPLADGRRPSSVSAVPREDGEHPSVVR